MAVYSAEWYRNRKNKSLESAVKVVPVIVDLVSPDSVVDLGCGTGDWLSVFRKSGAEDILGIDGGWIDRQNLEISQDRFLAYDLNDNLELDRKFDLAISIEAAEHFPEVNADDFVQNLVSLASVVVFSAAVPGQGGTGHVNEQWPSYWAKKFLKHNYLWVDCIRPKIWDDNQVAHWYKQNMILYVNDSLISQFDQISRYESCEQASLPMDLIHPDLFKRKSDLKRQSSSLLWKALVYRFQKKWINKR